MSSVRDQLPAPAPGHEHGGEGPTLSVVTALFNEEANVEPLYDALRAALERLGLAFEIIAVDDGSCDGSFAVLRALAAHDPRLRVVRLRRRFGQTSALAAGFERARGEIIVTLDADLQNDPADIAQLLAKIDEGYDVVSGWRADRKDPWLSRKLPSWIANRLIARITGVPLHDFGCTLKAYRAEVVRDLPLYGELHRLIPAIASWRGIAVAELRVRHHERVAGRSKYGIGRTLRVVLDVIAVRFLLSYSTRPIQMFGLLGVVSMLAGLALCGYLAALKLVQGAEIADRPLLLLGVLLIVVGVQFVAVGLVGELVVRLGTRPETYAVREELNPPVERVPSG